MALLKDYGVDTVFGIPGVHTVEMYRGIEASGLRHIVARNELGATFMADGYARITGKPGVCTLITGPGLTYAATAIAEAYADSIPLLILTAVNARRDLGMGRGKLHEITNQRALSAPITAWSHTVLDPDDMPLIVARAFAKLTAERPRPIHLEFPTDVLPLPVNAPKTKRALPLPPGPHPACVEEAVTLLKTAETPSIIVGGGAWGAVDPLRALAERLGAVVMSTVAGKGILPESHPLSAGMCLSDRRVDGRLFATDVAIVVGSELSDADIWIEGPLPLPENTIRIDLDSEELQADYPVKVPMLGDAALSLQALVDGLGQRPSSVNKTAETSQEWAAAMKGLAQRTEGLRTLHQSVLATMRDVLAPDAVVFNDMTQIAYAGHDLFLTEGPRQWNHPCGFGTLGYALPAAIGAKIAAPDRQVVALAGDGGLQFTLQELATAVENQLSLPIIVWDNKGFGEIRDSLMSSQVPAIGVDLQNPSFTKLAEAYGARSNTPTTPAALKASLEIALKHDRPTLIILSQDRFKAV